MKCKKGLLALEAPAKQIGSVKRRKDSSKLYVDFYYFGHRITRSTELDDTPANEMKVRDFLSRITERIEAGSFKFAEAFPGATDKEKAFFTNLEGREYRPEPHQVLFGEYLKEWKKSYFPFFSTPTKRRDYNDAIKSRILPYFKQMNFHQLTGQELFRFTETLKCRIGPNKGKPVSRARKINILIPLRAIWNDACDQHRWVIKSPFDNLHKKLVKTEKKEHTVIRFPDWLTFLDNLEEHYRPIAELMILTGMIPSELSALRIEDIDGEYINLNKSFVLGEETTTMKTAFRKRKIFVTQAIRQRLDILKARAKTPYLVKNVSGTRLNSNDFGKAWRKAVNKTQIPPVTSYSARHSFAAWSLIIGINPLRLVSLMGHASKQMVFEVYGNYVEGLEEDAENIFNYFGEDFLYPRKTKNPALFGDSTGDSRRFTYANHSTSLSF